MPVTGRVAQSDSGEALDCSLLRLLELRIEAGIVDGAGRRSRLSDLTRDTAGRSIDLACSGLGQFWAMPDGSHGKYGTPGNEESASCRFY
jgi:hypothetical protein